MNTDIYLEKQKIKAVIENISKPVIYKPSQYGIPDKYTGKGVKIVVIDSGCPKLKDIKIEGDIISFCENDKNEYDKIGHSTIISGIINANNRKTIKGLAPYAKVYYAKVIDSQGKCSFNSLVSAVLWSIVKKADILVIALGTQYDFSVLHDAIKKASASMLIFAAAGTIKSEDDQIDFPARYEQVFSVSCLTRSKKINNILAKKTNFCLPNNKKLTTYIDNSYIKIGGSSICTAIVAGMSALLIEKARSSTSLKSNPESIFPEIEKMFD
ncbi:MAG TPA: S8 family serine peptidase [Candidatus Paceibacterota bacterium]|nr:S8 family serine peptidase [Candidatus Paceibacterota bacterium]